jgi:hypothetical protein
MKHLLTIICLFVTIHANCQTDANSYVATTPILNYSTGQWNSTPTTQPDNNLAFTRENEVLNRTEFYNKSWQLIGYKIYNKIQERYEFYSPDNKLIMTSKWNEIMNRWDTQQY